MRCFIVDVYERMLLQYGEEMLKQTQNADDELVTANRAFRSQAMQFLANTQQEQTSPEQPVVSAPPKDENVESVLKAVSLGNWWGTLVKLRRDYPRELSARRFNNFERAISAATLLYHRTQQSRGILW